MKSSRVVTKFLKLSPDKAFFLTSNRSCAIVMLSGEFALRCSHPLGGWYQQGESFKSVTSAIAAYERTLLDSKSV